MLRCQKCGAKIEPDFDVCWNCGTALGDGHADPTDTADDFDPNDRIVELCSTANIIEAQAICAALEAEGIRCRIVGDELGNAAGWLPPGETLALRIWVRESEAARAGPVVDRFYDGHQPESERSNEIDDDEDYEEAAEPEEESPASEDRFGFLDQGFYIFGVLCLIIGAFWAWGNHNRLAEYSASTTGWLYGSKFVGMRHVPIPHREDIPFPIPKSLGLKVDRFPLYVYAVGDRVYDAVLEETGTPQQKTMILYKPDRPQDHIIGSITPPWMILVFTVGGSLLLMFIGYMATSSSHVEE